VFPCFNFFELYYQHVDILTEQYKTDFLPLKMDF
jgi:hypothetical protein